MLSSASILGVIIGCGLAAPAVALVSATTAGVSGVVWAMLYRCLR